MDIFERIKAEESDMGRLILDEVHGWNCYRVEPREVANSVVIDVGANIGIFSIMAAIFGAREVYAFEPDSINYQKLVGNTEEFKNIKTFKLAVTKPGVTQLHISGTEGNCRVADSCYKI